MERQQIADRVASFPRWHYAFDLKGITTPIWSEGHVNRHEQRRRHFLDALVKVCGGSLAGRRVLDLGCNAGFWSLAALDAGAGFVLGVDGRQMHIDQANFVFEVKDVGPDRYAFEVGNVFDFPFAEYGPFDIVLCLGLLYHVSKPMELFETMAACNADLLVIDTYLSRAPGSYFEARRDSLDEPRDAVDYELVLIPTRAAVRDLATQFGYHCAVLKPEFDDWDGATDYRTGFRRSFLCSKKGPIVGVETEGFGSASTMGDAGHWAVDKLKLRARRGRRGR